MRIPDIRQPDLFQRLVHRLYIAEYGHGLQVVDDSAGDRGNDGYDPERRLLLAIYCPEKDLTEAKALAKGRSDLAKAVRLRTVPGYRFDTWVFVTPAALPEKVQAALRAEVEAHGLMVQFFSGVHLEDIYLRHADLRPVFPEFDYPRVDQQLAAIHAKLDALAAPPTSSRPASAPEGRGDAATTTADPELFAPHLPISFGGAQLAELQRRVHAADPEALFDLERFRLESESPTDVAAALMIQVEYATERLDFATVRRVAAEGRRFASQHGLRAEEAVFLARETHADTVLLVAREMNFTAELAFGTVVGFPLVSLEAAERFDREVPAEHARLDAQFRQAYQLARDSRNLEAMFQAALYCAEAATQSAFPQRLLLEMAHRTEVRPRIAFYRRQMQASHGLAVSIGAALRSPVHLVLAYSNFANDLLTFDDLTRARSHALHARRLAQELDDPRQIEKTGRILELIDRRATDAAAVPSAA